MNKLRSKVIESIQYIPTADGVPDLFKWWDESDCEYRLGKDDTIIITTFGEEIEICGSDYIIKSMGKFSSCKEEIFKIMYE